MAAFFQESPRRLTAEAQLVALHCGRRPCQQQHFSVESAHFLISSQTAHLHAELRYANDRDPETRFGTQPPLRQHVSYAAVSPPSITNSAPVTHADSSDAR